MICGLQYYFDLFDPMKSPCPRQLKKETLQGDQHCKQ